MHKKIKWLHWSGEPWRHRTTVTKYPKSAKKFLPVEIEDFATPKPIKLAKLREELNERKKRLDALSEIKMFLANEKILQRDHKIRVDYSKKLIREIEKDPMKGILSRHIGEWREDLKTKTPQQLDDLALHYKKECAKSKRAMLTVQTMDWIETHGGDLKRSSAMRILINREIAKRKNK